MLADSNFNENFTADVPMGNFKKVWNNIHNCFLMVNLSITIKNNQLAWQTAIKKKRKEYKKHPQVFLKIGVLNGKILEKEIMGEVPGWRPAPHLL